nr:hypothetical protein [Tanacetum cinerariifolium]
MTDVYIRQEFKDSHVTLTLVNPDGQQQSSSVSSQFVISMLNPSPDADIDSLFETTPRLDVQALTTVASLTLTAPTLPPPTIPTISQQTQAPNPPTTAPTNFSEFMQTNQFARAVSSILEIIERYMDQRMNEAVKILIEKMKINKSIHRSDEQRNLYKALIDAYKSDKIILDTYGDTITLKRRCDDADKDEEPSAGSDRGSKRRREGKEPESTSALKEKATKTTVKSTQGSKSYQKTASESISDLAKQADSRSSFNELMGTPVDFSAFLMNRLKVDTLTLELLAGLIYELKKGLCKSLVELEFFLEEVYKATSDQLDWNNPEGQ